MKGFEYQSSQNRRPSLEDVGEDVLIYGDQDAPSEESVEIEENPFAKIPEMEFIQTPWDPEQWGAGEAFAEDLESDMVAIEQEFHLPIEEIENVRAEVGSADFVGGAKLKIQSIFQDIKAKFEKPKVAEKGEEYESLRKKLHIEDLERGHELIIEGREKLSQLLEDRGLFTLSKEDFQELFSSSEALVETGATLEQQNVGDCYLIAAIHAMSRSPQFETICRASMERSPDGSWKVKIPLLSKNGQIFTITQEDISEQLHPRFKEDVVDEWNPDGRSHLSPVNGNEGYRVLEAAYIKSKHGMMNGALNRLDAEGGYGDEALVSLGGENFRAFSAHSQDFNGKETSLTYLNEGKMAILDHYLENFNPDVHIMTASSLHTKGKLLGAYRVGGSLTYIYPGHAYSISNVDKENQTIVVVNPWDTKNPIELSFEQFKDNFRSLQAVRVDNAKLLDNMKNLTDVV